jgi:hypothetical protein
MIPATRRRIVMRSDQHPRGCHCDPCRRKRLDEEIQPWERSRYYFADLGDPNAAAAKRRARRDAAHEADVDRQIDKLLARQQDERGDPARERLARRRALETR